MPLLLSAIVPHPPILIPTIGKNHLKRLKATLNSYEKLKNKLSEKKIDTIIIISPHGKAYEDAFTINFNPKLICDFKDFGDFSTQKEWDLDIELAYKIKENLETTTPLQLNTNDFLDHGSSVPLYILTESLKNIKIIPIHHSGLSLREHFNFGEKLKTQIFLSNKNIAIIASGDLSHALSKDSPAGYSPKGKKFDKKIIELLNAKKIDEILNLDPKFIDEAKECGLRSFLIQQGILKDVNYKAKTLSYEAPFGVGYLVMDFEIN